MAENFDKIYAMSGGYNAEGANQELQQLFEERLAARWVPADDPLRGRDRSFFPSRGLFKLEVDAEMILYGVTEPDSHVAVRGEPVETAARRQLYAQDEPAESPASDSGRRLGGQRHEQRTIVLALERNTKVMEPVVRQGQRLKAPGVSAWYSHPRHLKSQRPRHLRLRRCSTGLLIAPIRRGYTVSA